MLSFHNDPKLKQRILTQLKAHYKADEIIKGVYWEKGKGCAVGCTIHSNNHNDYEDILGIPVILARLEDNIFGGLDNKLAKEFPVQFIEAIPVGVDLSGVYNKWVIRLLKRIRIYAFDDGKEAIDAVIKSLERGTAVDVAAVAAVAASTTVAVAVADAVADGASVAAAAAVTAVADAAVVAAVADAAADVVADDGGVADTDDGATAVAVSVGTTAVAVAAVAVANAAVAVDIAVADAAVAVDIAAAVTATAATAATAVAAAVDVADAATNAAVDAAVDVAAIAAAVVAAAAVIAAADTAVGVGTERIKQRDDLLELLRSLV